MNNIINTGTNLDKAIDQTIVKRKGFRAYTRLGWAFCILLVAEAVLPSLVLILLNVVAPNVVSNPWLGTPLVYICLYLIGFPLMLLVLRKLPDVTPAYEPGEKKNLGFGTWLALYPIAFAVLTVFNVIGTGIQQLIGKTNTVTTADLASTPLPWWVMFIIGVVIAPVMEEIMFRYLTYKKVSGYGAGIYIIWSSLFFGLFHLNFGQSLYAGFLGVLFAVIMYKTGSVLYSIGLHVLVNFSGGVGLGSIIMRAQNETVTTIYTVYLSVLSLLGVILFIVFLVRKFFVIHEQPTENTLANKKVAFLNPSSILFSVACVAIIVLGFLS